MTVLTNRHASVARDLLARQMFMAEKAADGFDLDDCASMWDDDCLLTDVYEEYEAKATDAILAHPEGCANPVSVRVVVEGE